MRRGYRHRPTSKAPALGVLAVSCLFTMASAAAQDTQERALSRTIDDPQLEWMACPEFMPEGCEFTILHGDPEADNADVFFKVPGNATVPRHWHTSAERMVLVTGEMHLDYDDQDLMELEPGTYIFGPAELPHEAICVSDDPCVLFIAFEAPVDAIPVDGSPEN